MATKTETTEVSEFYSACRNGNVEFVKNYLKMSSPKKGDLNNMEPIVNSTPLHAASYNGHKEIVQLLLDSGCERSQKNGLGFTAYEEAANDEIRQLFQRPAGLSGILRFQDDNIDDCFHILKQSKASKTKRKSKD